MEHHEFHLIGHINLQDYPGPVVPIVEKNNYLYAIYIDDPSPIARFDGKYVRHKIKDKHLLKDYIYDRHCLFALGESEERPELTLYEKGRERDFFLQLLHDSTFAYQTPLLRLSMAKKIKDPLAIGRELEQSEKHLRNISPVFAKTWAENQYLELNHLRIDLEKKSRSLKESRSHITYGAMSADFVGMAEVRQVFKYLYNSCRVLRDKRKAIHFVFVDSDIAEYPVVSESLIPTNDIHRRRLIGYLHAAIQDMTIRTDESHIEQCFEEFKSSLGDFLEIAESQSVAVSAEENCDYDDDIGSILTRCLKANTRMLNHIRNEKGHIKNNNGWVTVSRSIPNSHITGRKIFRGSKGVATNLKIITHTGHSNASSYPVFYVDDSSFNLEECYSKE